MSVNEIEVLHTFKWNLQKDYKLVR